MQEPDSLQELPLLKHHYTPGDVPRDDPAAYEDLGEMVREDEQPEAVGECVDCGVPIRYGEWHVALRPDCDRIPDEAMMAVKLGDPDETTRWCGPCSDRPLGEYPEDGTIAGGGEAQEVAADGE